MGKRRRRRLFRGRVGKRLKNAVKRAGRLAKKAGQFVGRNAVGGGIGAALGMTAQELLRKRGNRGSSNSSRNNQASPQQRAGGIFGAQQQAEVPEKSFIDKIVDWVENLFKKDEG